MYSIGKVCHRTGGTYPCHIRRRYIHKVCIRRTFLLYRIRELSISYSNNRSCRRIRRYTTLRRDLHLFYGQGRNIIDTCLYPTCGNLTQGTIWVYHTYFQGMSWTRRRCHWSWYLQFICTYQCSTSIRSSVELVLKGSSSLDVSEFYQ